MRALIFTLILLVLWACHSDAPPVFNPTSQLDIVDLTRHIKVLSSDEFEGRAPSSPGEEKTVNYLVDQFTTLGVEPGNEKSFLQPVPMVAITASNKTEIVVEKESLRVPLQYGEDMIIWTKQVEQQVSLDQSELVFVGYGIVAPEYDWNDYAGLDVRGKTVLILVNDPGYATGVDSVFNGKSMTYYGRWTYKFEEAARQGATAALIIHQTGPAGYPWGVVTGSWSGKQFDLVEEDGNASRCKVEGWVSEPAGRLLFESAGLTLEEALESAKNSDFEATSLELFVSTTIVSQIERSESQNVIAKITGAERPDEYVIYSAHWDHLGKNASLEGDQIYNGARDNATGTAALLEMAQAFIGAPRPARTVLLLAVTGEEKGLLGSAYYARNPIYPVEKTIANINMDALDIWGPMNDVIVIGYGNSQLDAYLEKAAQAQGRKLRPDPEPEKGSYFRSDHFSFAKQGVPALYAKGGIDHREKGEEWTLKQKAEHTANRYHKPADEFDETWDLTGTIEDLELLFAVGLELANTEDWPNWNEGVAFKATRDEQKK